MSVTNNLMSIMWDNILLISGLMSGLMEELRYGNRYPGIKTTTIHPFVIDTGLAHKPRIR